MLYLAKCPCSLFVHRRTLHYFHWKNNMVVVMFVIKILFLKQKIHRYTEFDKKHRKCNISKNSPDQGRSNYFFQCRNIFNWTTCNKLQWYPNRNLYLFHSRKCIWKWQEIGGHFVLASTMTFTMSKSWVCLYRHYLTYVYHWMHVCIANGTSWFTCSFFFSHPPINLCCQKRGYYCVMRIEYEWREI